MLLLFRLIYIARFVLSLYVFVFERQNTKLSVNVFLSCIIYCDVEPGCHLNCLQAVGRFLWRNSSCPRTFFLLKRHSFTSRKVYISQETVLSFLQLSDRAYVSRARCIDLVLFLVFLAPRDDGSNYGSFFAHLSHLIEPTCVESSIIRSWYWPYSYFWEVYECIWNFIQSMVS